MRKYIKIKDEQHSVEVQNKLFEMGCEWIISGKKIQYMNMPFLIIEGDLIRYGSESWTPSEDDVEVVIKEKTEYFFEEVVEVVELNGKRYNKRDLEEALKSLTPLED